MTKVPFNLISAAECRRRLGGISAMSLWRWVHSPELKFPQPTMINRRRYWVVSEIDAWLASRRVSQVVGGDHD